MNHSLLYTVRVTMQGAIKDHVIDWPTSDLMPKKSEKLIKSLLSA